MRGLILYFDLKKQKNWCQSENVVSVSQTRLTVVLVVLKITKCGVWVNFPFNHSVHTFN